MTAEESQRPLVPRREFLKYSTMFVAGSAAAVVLTSDARSQSALTSFFQTGPPPHNPTYPYDP